MAWLVMEQQQLFGTKWQRGVSLPPVIAEFDFVHAWREPLDDCSNLPAPKRRSAQVLQQCNYG